MRPWLALIAIPALYAASPAVAQIRRIGNRYEFRAKFTKGEVLRYEIVSAATPPGSSAPVRLTRPIVMTVQDVKNGIASVKVINGPTILNGQRLGDPQSADVQINDHGKMMGPESAGMLGAGQFLPEKPLAIGDTFQSTSRVVQPGLDTSVKVVSRLAGFKTIRGHQTARFDLTIAGKGAIAIAGRGSSYFDMADGQLVAMNSTQDITLKHGTSELKLRNVATVVRK